MGATLGTNAKITASVASLAAGTIGLGVAGASLMGIQSGAYAATPESFSSVNWTGLLSLLPTGAGLWGIVSAWLKSTDGKNVLNTVVDVVSNNKRVVDDSQKTLVAVVDDMAKKLVESTGTDIGGVPETAALSILWATRSNKGDVEGAKLVTELSAHIYKANQGGKK